jgi:primary-amine oxidase
MRRRGTFALALAAALSLLCATRASAAQPSFALTPAQLAALQRSVAADRSVRAALGRAVDIVRVQPAGAQPGRFVVDLATPDRSSGLRLLTDAASASILREAPLATDDIPFDESDVATAFALVKDAPSLRTALGNFDDYRVREARGPGSAYNIEGLVVRGSEPADPCTLDRCLELLFRRPAGYVDMPPVLVDLTRGTRLEAAEERSGALHHAAQPRTLDSTERVRVLPSVERAAERADCQTLTFSNAPSSWHVCWYFVPGFGLVLGPVSYKQSATAHDFHILADARVDQIFVPYAKGHPRYYDVNFLFPLASLPPAVCPGGRLLDEATVCLETRDRGVDWLYAGAARVLAGREGQETVLWSALDADNYQYVEEWHFRDDGSLSADALATGENLPGDRQESHTHDFFWRVVPDLAGRGNSVDLVTHSEPLDQLKASDVFTPLTQPGAFQWDPQAFDEFDAFAPGNKNDRGDQISFRLVPEPTGGLAHHNESFTRKDLWATAGDPFEIDASDLPLYAREQTTLVDTRLALWYRGSFHHEPRDEDGYFSGKHWIGTTHTAGTGFQFESRNLFDHSPFFP